MDVVAASLQGGLETELFTDSTDGVTGVDRKTLRLLTAPIVIQAQTVPKKMGHEIG